MMPGLSPAERTKLVGILGMLGSDHDGERAAAAALAARMVREKGLSWDEVVQNGHARQSGTPYAKPSRPGTSGARPDPMVQAYHHLNHLSEWERNFVTSLDRQRKPPTPAQTAKLAQIADSLTVRGLV